MLIPFGKYKGQDLTVVPDEYLLWLTANIPLREPLLSAVVEEITERDLKLPPLPSPSPRQVRRPRDNEDDGAWTAGGDPQEIIAGDFPISSRQRSEH